MSIKVAIIIGEHPYQVQAFQNAFTVGTDFDVFVQGMEFFTGSSKEERENYDVVVFYNFHQHQPAQGTGWDELASLSQLGDTKQGILVLHHAILAYPEWDFWSKICCIPNRSFSYHVDEHVAYNVVKEHPITNGVQNFSLVDETYCMDSAAADSEILISTEHNTSMRSILWTHNFKNSRVVCFQSGHDNRTYCNPSFRKLLHNSICWLAHRI
jgi:trehalose utilization protein